MKRFVFISRNYKHPGCGGGRARTDIEMVMERMGYENIGLRRTTSGNGIVHSLRNMWSTLHAIGKMREGDVVVIQYQMKMYGRICRAAHRRGAKVICLIHDLDSWRDKRLTPEQEMPLLNMADVLLTHNHAMRRWLTEHGCHAPMVDYEIMDYLHGVSAPAHPIPSDGKFSLFFVGNLSSELNDWIYQLAGAMPQRDIYLYGSEFDAERAAGLSNIHMMGERPDTEIIASHHGDFGISWYGLSLDEGIGKVGEYMAINNPHKVGLYLRSNSPVVVWSRAGRAEFVLHEGVGIATDSLRDLDKALDAITPNEYARLTKNVERVNRNLKSGFYLRQALTQAIKIIEESQNKI